MSDQNPPSGPTGPYPPPPDQPGPPSQGSYPPPPPPGPGQGYGQPPGQGYSPPPGPGYSPPTRPASSAGWNGPPLADWSKRAYSFLIDYLAPSLLSGFFYNVNRPLGFFVSLAVFAWVLYNAYISGETGQSIGKKQAGIRLLRASDGQVIGGGLGIGRYFLHILDAIPCYLGFLWPLWDAKRQTFADKILNTIVVDEGTRR